MSDQTPADRAREIIAQPEPVELPEGIAPGADTDPPPAEMPPLDSYDDDYPGGDAPPAPPDGEGAADDIPPEKRCAQFPLNDLGNGKRFVVHFGEDVLFVSQVGWFVWDGARWCKDAEIIRDVAPMIRARAQRISGLIEGEIPFLEPSPRDRQLLEQERELRQRRREIENTPGASGDEALMSELEVIGRRLRARSHSISSQRGAVSSSPRKAALRPGICVIRGPAIPSIFTAEMPSGRRNPMRASVLRSLTGASTVTTSA